MSVGDSQNVVIASRLNQVDVAQTPIPKLTVGYFFNAIEGQNASNQSFTGKSGIDDWKSIAR
jgi:hypothetical protein